MRKKSFGKVVSAIVSGLMCLTTVPAAMSLNANALQEPDETGNYLVYAFDNDVKDWSGRGDARTSNDKNNYYDGGASMFVSGRKDTWHGASIALPSSVFKAGGTYSFSAAAMQKSGTPADIKMTLQYSDGSGEKYDEIALVNTISGQWTKIENTAYTIPAGASDLTLYFEAPEGLIDFYIDSFAAGVEGSRSAVSTGSGVVEGGGDVIIAPPTGLLKGDFSGDRRIDSFDIIAGRKALVNSMAGSSGAVSTSVSDVDGDGAFAVNDLVVLCKFILGQITEFPQAAVVSSTTTKIEPIVTTTAAPSISSGDFMASISNDMKISAPDNFNRKRGGVDYGKVEKVTYTSRDGNCQKSMNVILPAGYSSGEKYPVLYVLHGIGGNEDSMVQMGVQTMLGNLLADGLCEKMIIVCPSMLTGQGGGGMGFDQETMRKYDLIREDIENSIMPYMEQHYSIKTGRENTAVTGFSLGGREALYTGITRSELYGYVGGACAAPGIFPTTDMFMTHEGSLKTESEFKPSTMPEMILISAAQNDGVVGTYPESYHKALQGNSVEHLWQIIPQGDHGNATVDPHMYNFLRYVFKA